VFLIVIVISGNFAKGDLLILLMFNKIYKHVLYTYHIIQIFVLSTFKLSPLLCYIWNYSSKLNLKINPHLNSINSLIYSLSDLLLLMSKPFQIILEVILMQKFQIRQALAFTL